MSGKDMESASLEHDKVLCDELTEILLILTNAERQGKDLEAPLKKVSSMVDALENDYLTNLHQKLLRGFQTGSTDDQLWADTYFTFILDICDLLNVTKWNIDKSTKKTGSTLLQA